jgi:hypothetical protein
MHLAAEIKIMTAVSSTTSGRKGFIRGKETAKSV